MSNLGKILIVVLLIAIIITIKIKQNDKMVETPLSPAATQNTNMPIPVTVRKTQPVQDKSQPEKKVTEQKTKTTSTQKKVAPAVKVQKDTTPAVISTPLPRFLELGSDSCRPCQMMQPVLAELRKEFADKLQVDFIDVYQDKTASEKYNLQFIPTQVFFDADGKEIFRHTGFYPKVQILNKFKELNVKL